MPHKSKRITAASDLEKILTEPGWKPGPLARKRELEAMARAGAAKRRGGARPGAGRKPLGHVVAFLNLKPQTKAYLAKMGGPRGMGAAVDLLVEKALRGKASA